MRRWVRPVIVASLIVALPALALGATAWSLSVSPQGATHGQATVFSLTLVNQGSSKLGCLEVDLPPSFSILSLGNPSASNGQGWSSAQNGNTVAVDADSKSGELDQGESLTFTITARPAAAGSFSWTNAVHTKQNCKKNMNAGPPLQVTVVPGGPPPPTPPPPTPPPPTPVPTATPKPAATPASTPAPASTPSGASPAPTTDEQSSSAGPTGSARPTTPASAPGGGGTGGPNDLRMAPLPGSDDGTTNDLGTGLDILGMLDGQFVWFVPGAAVGVPGLLVIAFVVLQGIGAMAWIPATRRLSGDDQPARRRPLRPA